MLGGLIAHHWSFEPGIIVGLGVLTVPYIVGVRRLWKSAGNGRGVSKCAAFFFATGVAALVLALVSPLDAVADSLQSAHMVQHLLLILVAPPLLLLGQPLRACPWMLTRAARIFLARKWTRMQTVRRVASILASPAVAFGLHTAALVVWHLPTPYDEAVRSDSVHAFEHFSFLSTALLFWWVVLAPKALRKLHRALDVPYVIAMSLVCGALGAVLTFASVPLYSAYLTTASTWGLTPLEDQQLAGLIMWIPGGLIYLIAAGVLFYAWVESSGRRLDQNGEGTVISAT